MLKVIVLGSATAILLAGPANAADLKSEIVNAQTHAGLAAKATTIDGVHMHLHHALNCLAGPNGAGYDAKQMNPCAHSGDGAITDTADATKKKALEDAAAKATSGIAETNLADSENCTCLDGGQAKAWR